MVHADAPAAFGEFLEPLGGDRHHHALLGLRQPDLPWLEPGVLAGHPVEVDVGTDPLGHLAHRRRQSAGSAVGDARVEVFRADEGVDQELLDDRIADLHTGAGDLSRGGVHRRRRERGTADAVAPRGAAEHDDPVAGERPIVDRPRRGDADASGEDQRIGRVRRVVEHCAGDGGEPDLVPVVGDSVDDAGSDAQRVQRPGGKLVDREVGRAEAQHVGHEDRTVRHAEDVADHAADARVGATERLDGRWVVVRLCLEGQCRAGCELHHSGIADERRPDERCVERLGARAQPLHQGLDRFHLGTVVVAEFDRRAERLVGAVFAPRLGQRFEFEVGRIAVERLEVVTDHPQFGRVERERPRAIDLGELLVVEAPDRDDLGGAGRHVDVRRSHVDRAVRPSLDDRIRHQAIHQFVDRRVVDGVVELESPCRACVVHVEADGRRGVDDGVDVAVGDSGQRGHLDRAARRDRPAAVLEQGIDEHRLEFLAACVVEVPVDEHDVGDVQASHRWEAEVLRTGEEGVDPGVGIDRTDGQSIPRGHWRDPTE